jgi:N-acetylneuraminic acid mutarotase
MSTNNKPVHKIRYGSVIASIWADNSTSGYFYNTTFCKMPPQQNSWENSGSGRSPIV